MEIDCTDIKNSMYVFSMAIGGLIEAMGMHALNQYRIDRGETIAYDDEAFNNVIKERGLHHDTIVTKLNGL